MTRRSDMVIPYMVICLLLQHPTRSASSDDPYVRHVGRRFYPPRSRDDDVAMTEEPCRAGRLCVGPGTSYPLGRQVGVLFSSVFTVPDLPQVHDPVDEFTYYDYFNIFWPTATTSSSDATLDVTHKSSARSGGYSGYMNQFVPQLMLGNALANSSNYPDYDPQWIELETWHIGAQYFMGLCPHDTATRATTNNTTSTSSNSSCPDSWIAKAATGELIPVEPGEVIETTIRLVELRGRRWEWHLRIGVVGQPHRTSVVVADRPFLGLVPSTRSWKEDAYGHVYSGSCLENYGMTSSQNYPPVWQIRMEIWSSGRRRVDWMGWRMSTNPVCPWQPKSIVTSNHTSTIQWAMWEANLEQLAFDTSVQRNLDVN